MPKIGDRVKVIVGTFLYNPTGIIVDIKKDYIDKKYHVELDVPLNLDTRLSMELKTQRISVFKNALEVIEIDLPEELFEI